MIKLLQIMSGAHVGGAEKFFERLVIAFHNAGMEQHVAIRENSEREKLFHDAGLVPTTHKFGGLLDLTSQKELNLIANNFEPDIALAWMNRGAKFIPKGPFVKAARLGGYYDLKYYKKCEYLVGNTQDICKYLRAKGWPADKVWYLPNFVDDTVMPPQDRSELDTPQDAPLLLGLGRLHENKAFDLGLEVLTKVPTAYYWIAGTGPKEHELKAKADLLGVSERVRFLGWRSDIAALFAASDIFLCTSRHEPLGNMMIEAWANGTPVVAAASQGPTEHIIDGENGLLSPIDDAEEMAKNVQKIIAHPDLAMEIAGHGNQSYKAAYTEGQVVARYQEFFDTILKNKN